MIHRSELNHFIKETDISGFEPLVEFIEQQDKQMQELKNLIDGKVVAEFEGYPQEGEDENGDFSHQIHKDGLCLIDFHEDERDIAIKEGTRYKVLVIQKERQ
jgi:hypothetical protein